MVLDGGANPPDSMTESGGIGIHGRLKICCLSACGFESRLSDSGLIVQLGERCLCKAEVGGSSPPQSTDGRMAEWLKALVLKTGVGIRCLPWVRIPLLPFPCSVTVTRETLDLFFLVRIQAREFSVHERIEWLQQQIQQSINFLDSL